MTQIVNSKIVESQTPKAETQTSKSQKRDISINSFILETQTANSQTVETQKLRIKSQHNLQ